MITNKYDKLRIEHLEYHLFSSFLDWSNIMSYIGETLKGSPDFQGWRAQGGSNSQKCSKVCPSRRPIFQYS